MNNAKKTLSLAKTVCRHLNTTAARNAEAEVTNPRFHKLKEIQKKFGVEDNVPVYLKGGVFDKLLFQATTLLTVAGLALSFQTFYVLIKK